MINQYAETMRAFYRSVNRKIESDSSKLALAYANHFWKTSDQVHRHSYQKVFFPQDRLENVSILARDTSLSFLTKRVTLIADTTVITEVTNRIFSIFAGRLMEIHGQQGLFKKRSERVGNE
jgi:hypothetical protein